MAEKLLTNHTFADLQVGDTASLTRVAGDTDVTFVLASGGHNAGIVSEPGHRGRRYRIATRLAADICLGPDEWAAEAEERGGSWWEAWLPWLATHSGKVRVAPPQLGAAERGFPAIAEAPGAYVFQK